MLRATTAAGDFSHAEQILRQARDTDGKQTVDAVADLIRAMVRAGDVDGAERIVRSLGDPGPPAHLLVTLAGEVAGAGDLARATRIAHGLGEPDREDTMRFIERVSNSQEHGTARETGPTRQHPAWHTFASQGEEPARQIRSQGNQNPPEAAENQGWQSLVPVRSAAEPEPNREVETPRTPNRRRRRAFFDGLALCLSFGRPIRTEDRDLLRAAIRNVASVSRTIGDAR